MSTISEMVEREAAEAEAEPEPTEPEPGEPEPEPEPEPAEPEDAAPELPAFDPKKLEAEQKRHDKALDTIFGGLDAFDACGDCGGLGIVPKGLEAPPTLKQHPDLVPCPDCDALGRMLTGSRNPQYVDEPCVTCTGRGYVDRAAIEAKRQAEAFAAQAHVQQPPPPPVWDAARGAYVDHLGQVLGTPPPMVTGGYPA